MLDPSWAGAQVAAVNAAGVGVGHEVRTNASRQHQEPQTWNRDGVRFAVVDQLNFRQVPRLASVTKVDQPCAALFGHLLVWRKLIS